MKTETQRLIIRPLTAKDGGAMKEILTDFENSHLSIYDYPAPTDDYKIEMLLPIWTKSRKYYIIHHKAENRPIGFLVNDKGDIGFNILSSHHRKGYGYESLSAFLNMLAGKYKAFTAQAAAENTASVKLLTKAGFCEKSREYILFRQGQSPKECIHFKLKR